MEIKAEKISKTYGTHTVLNDVSFSLERGQKAGLIGYNGTGKTTLLKILAGIVEPDSGEVITKKGATIGYMPQDTSLVSDETVNEYVRRVSGIAALEKQMEESGTIPQEYERRDGYTFYHRLEVMLAGFGLVDISTDRSIRTLSSGQKSKVFAVGMLLSDPDILLLDEPTNNLDLPALIWLEDFLMRSEAACIIVSHDRLFLDRIVRKIFEIDWQSRALIVTSGRYSDYLVRKEKGVRRQLLEHEAQQKEIKRLEQEAQKKKQEAQSGSKYVGTDHDKFLRGFKRDRAGKSGKQAKAIEKRIGQMTEIEKPIERDAFRINLESTKPKGARDITLSDVVAGYSDESFTVGPVSLSIPYGSRIAILGLNGVGKTTLLQTISGELLPRAGVVDSGKGLTIGNMTQEHDTLPRGERIKDFLLRRTGRPLEEIYALMVKYGFKTTEIDKPISVLSPGGRARLLFALFSSLSVNALILDEPTNHIDLEALEALQEAVAHYTGTIILVTHDRQFLEHFNPTDIYVLSEGKISRQHSFAEYMADAEQQAKRLINML